MVMRSRIPRLPCATQPAAGRRRRLDIDSWFGAVVVAGDGPDLRTTALTMPFVLDDPTTGHLLEMLHSLADARLLTAEA